MADLFCSNLNELRQVSVSGLSNLTEAYIGVLRSKFIWITNEGGQDDNQTVIIPDTNPPSGRWICPQAPLIPNQTIPWSSINKDGSSLHDITTKSATELEEGTLNFRRLPEGLPYFASILPNLIITTDVYGNFQLTKITTDQIEGAIPFARINWEDFSPEMIGAESVIYYNPDQFDVDDQNNVSVKVMSQNQHGLAIPGRGISTNNQGSIEVNFGTGQNEALEGITPLGGDLSGQHDAAVVDALRNVPLTFNRNSLGPFDNYVLTLNSKNENNPFFVLTPKGGGGGGGSDLPPIDGERGALLTDGARIYWDLIPESFIKPNFAITSFNSSTTILEVGQTVTNPHFTALYNDYIDSGILSDNLGHNDTLSLSYTSFYSFHTFTSNVISSVTFTLTVTASSDGSQHTANSGISWLTKVFYGVYEDTSDYITLINSLQSSVLTSSRNRSITVTAGASDYIYYAFPSSFGDPTFMVGGFAGGFSKVGSNISVTNNYGVTLDYDVWKSDNLDLGLTTVSVT